MSDPKAIKEARRERARERSREQYAPIKRLNQQKRLLREKLVELTQNEAYGTLEELREASTESDAWAMVVVLARLDWLGDLSQFLSGSLRETVDAQGVITGDAAELVERMERFKQRQERVSRELKRWRALVASASALCPECGKAMTPKSYITSKRRTALSRRVDPQAGTRGACCLRCWARDPLNLTSRRVKGDVPDPPWCPRCRRVRRLRRRWTRGLKAFAEGRVTRIVCNACVDEETNDGSIS